MTITLTLRLVRRGLPDGDAAVFATTWTQPHEAPLVGDRVDDEFRAWSTDSYVRVRGLVVGRTWTGSGLVLHVEQAAPAEPETAGTALP